MSLYSAAELRKFHYEHVRKSARCCFRAGQQQLHALHSTRHSVYPLHYPTAPNHHTCHIRSVQLNVVNPCLASLVCTTPCTCNCAPGTRSRSTQHQHQHPVQVQLQVSTHAKHPPHTDVCGVYRRALHTPMSRMEICRIFINFQFFLLLRIFLCEKRRHGCRATLGLKCLYDNLEQKGP